jgi:hypothetical protein
LWDVPFERLAGREIVATGDRAHDLAVRLRYAGVPVTVGVGRAARALSAVTSSFTGMVDVLANYTAFRELVASLEH